MCSYEYAEQIGLVQTSEPELEGQDEPMPETLPAHVLEECPETLRNSDVWGEDGDDEDRVSRPEDMRHAVDDQEAALYAEHCCDDDDRFEGGLE